MQIMSPPGLRHDGPVPPENGNNGPSAASGADKQLDLPGLISPPRMPIPASGIRHELGSGTPHGRSPGTAPGERPQRWRPAAGGQAIYPDANTTWLIFSVDPSDLDRLFGLCDLELGFPEAYVAEANSNAALISTSSFYL